MSLAGRRLAARRSRRAGHSHMYLHAHVNGERVVRAVRPPEVRTTRRRLAGVCILWARVSKNHLCNPNPFRIRLCSTDLGPLLRNHPLDLQQDIFGAGRRRPHAWCRPRLLLPWLTRPSSAAFYLATVTPSSSQVSRPQPPINSRVSCFVSSSLTFVQVVSGVAKERHKDVFGIQRRQPRGCGQRKEAEGGGRPPQIVSHVIQGRCAAGDSQP